MNQDEAARLIASRIEALRVQYPETPIDVIADAQTDPWVVSAEIRLSHYVATVMARLYAGGQLQIVTAYLPMSTVEGKIQVGVLDDAPDFMDEVEAGLHRWFALRGRSQPATRSQSSTGAGSSQVRLVVSYAYSTDPDGRIEEDEEIRALIKQARADGLIVSVEGRIESSAPPPPPGMVYDSALLQVYEFLVENGEDIKTAGDALKSVAGAATTVTTFILLLSARLKHKRLRGLKIERDPPEP